MQISVWWVCGLPMGHRCIGPDPWDLPILLAFSGDCLPVAWPGHGGPCCSSAQGPMCGCLCNSQHLTWVLVSVPDVDSLCTFSCLSAGSLYRWHLVAVLEGSFEKVILLMTSFVSTKVRYSCLYDIGLNNVSALVKSL